MPSPAHGATRKNRSIFLDRGWIGAAIGVGLGLAITLVLYLRHDAIPSSVDLSERRASDRVRARIPQDDDVRTLAASESSPVDSKSIALNPKAEALIFVIDARMQTGNYDKALKAALAIEEGPARDVGLKEIADLLVPPEAQANLNRIDSESDRTRASAIEKLRKLVSLSDLAEGGLIKSRLLLRAAMVKRLLDEVRPGARDTIEDVTDSESLIARAEAIAEAMPAVEIKRLHPFQWIWGIVLTGVLGANWICSDAFSSTGNQCVRSNPRVLRCPSRWRQSPC